MTDLADILELADLTDEHIRTTVDALGELRARIDTLAAQAKEMEDILKSEGDGEYEGLLYRVTVKTSTSKRVAWKKVAERLGPSRQLLQAHTTEVTSTRVRPTAKLKRAA